MQLGVQGEKTVFPTELIDIVYYIVLHKQMSRHQNTLCPANAIVPLHPASPHPASSSDYTMSLTIMRRIRFCAGHRLHRHGGKCEYFHGHNYIADFYVTGDQVDD